MSWLFSQVLVEEYLEGSDLDGEPSAQSSGNHTQQAYCAPDKMTAFSKRSLSGMTFKPLMENRGEELLMSYLADFPVKTSPAPEREQASQENDPPCGHTWRELCLRCDPDTSMLKTVRCLWEEDLEPSSVTLPKWGMMRNGELWERTTLPRLTSGTESGLWLTPTCMNIEPTEERRDKRTKYRASIGRKDSPGGLAEQVVTEKFWPTPCTRDYKGANAEDGLTRNDGKSRMDQLPNAVAHGDNPEPEGQLSPDWVEWLMGWPIGWTRLEPIELDERGWETDPADEPGDIPRVATGIKARADRLKAIGNGQVPQAAELAWRILTQ